MFAEVLQGGKWKDKLFTNKGENIVDGIRILKIVLHLIIIIF